MDWEPIIRSFTLMFVLLNPFLMSVYLLQIIREMDRGTFTRVMIRGGLISVVVFFMFAALGDAIFQDVLQVRFAAFMLFGGIVFLVIALRFMFRGPDAIEMMRGSPDHVAGAVAMPFMIGPGTINASVIAGSQLPLSIALATILAAVGAVVTGVWLLKSLHDFVSRRNGKLVTRYVDLTGRISALVIGSISIEMMFQAIERWLATMNAAAAAG